LNGATLRVERSVEETRAGLRLKPPKTKRGRRNIALPTETVTMLRAHKVQQIKLRLALGMGRPDATTPVFTDIEGRLIKPISVTHWCVALLLLTGCRGSRFTRCGTPTCPRLSMLAWTSSPLADVSDTRRRLSRLTFTAT
jgi:hypothetical protein